MIAIRDVRKSFGSNLVLDGISLDVVQGEVVCVIGPSGSGTSCKKGRSKGSEAIAKFPSTFASSRPPIGISKRK